MINDNDFVRLNGPEDAIRLVEDTLSEIRFDGKLSESASKVTQLLQVFCKLYELQKISDLEARITAIESTLEGKR